MRRASAKPPRFRVMRYPALGATLLLAARGGARGGAPARDAVVALDGTWKITVLAVTNAGAGPES